MSRVEFLTPAGRLVQGSLYKPNTQDAEGKPLVNKSGANAGQPRKDFFFALAIPKGAERAWWETTWGQIIMNVGRTAFPQAFQAPTFAWKVKDGDSTIPNRRGKVPSKQEGYPGNWVLSFSSGYAPKVVRENGSVPMPEENAVNLGDYVQVWGTVDGNGSAQQPGIFLNHSIVNFLAYGQRIVVGPDPTAVGFGQGVVLPAGASATPPAGAWNPAAAAPAGAPAMPGAAPAMVMPGAAPAMAMPGAPAMPGAAPAMAMPGAAPVAVQPHPGFLQPGVAPAMPGAVAPPPAPTRQMTPKAAGVTYEQFIAQNWNDALLVQHGYMLA